ncbi:MAG: c-type cytochrome [Chloroflexi bacterium]|nr:c-type cytochrome [Chloroflexota bacterium]
MKKVLKWIGIVLGGLIGLLVIAFIGLAIYGSAKFHANVDRPVYEISADTSPEGLARGEYLVRDLVACQGCHGPEVEEGQEVERNAPLAGHAEDIVFGPIKAGFNTANLTPDPETGLGSWTDAEIARAIREGIDRDGVVLAIMPSGEFRSLSDADVSAIVGYLRSMEPVRNEIPPVTVNLVGKIALAIGLFGPPNPRPAVTPGGELVGWSEADFINTLRTGVNPAGRQLDDTMPWKDFARWHDEDFTAVFKYLQSLPAVSSK